MSAVLLILYSRKGCCLCEELDRRLRCLPLKDLTPPLELRVIDIDAVDTPKEVRVRYDLQVPVMVLGSIEMRSKDVVNTLEHFSGQGSPRNKATNTP